MELWRITLFGQLRLWHADTELRAFQHRKAGTLLALLACQQQTWHNRSQLAAQLWPDSEQDAAKLSLRVALSRIRERLGSPAVIETQGERLRLSHTLVQVDVSQFEQAIMQQSWEAAVSLYTSPLLPHYDELWIATERERLTDKFLHALLQLIEGAEATQSWDTAIDYARRAVSAAPLREDLHQKLLRLYLRSGRSADAQTHFRTLEKLLREELQALPSSETRALLKNTQLLANTQPVAPPVSPPLPMSLPLPKTHFIGRKVELTRLLEKLTQPGELVSIVGFGGIGKTRLAQEAVRHLTGTTTYWVPLADTAKDDSLWNTLLENLNRQTSLPLVPLSVPAQERVQAILSFASTLLILDNTEHLKQDTLQAVVSQLRALCPTLTLLLTSRSRLGLDDEQVFALEPLTITETAQLFEKRAQLVRPDFALTSQNASTIQSLCEQLEGIPLAIEMAAARVSILTPHQIASRLDKRFSLLINQSNSAPKRHRTLEATLDWSYHLLTPEQQNFLAILTIFRGGWTLEAAEAVSEDPAALEHTQILVNASLIHPYEVNITRNTKGMRYRMLETIRAYVTKNPIKHTDRIINNHIKWINIQLERTKNIRSPHQSKILEQETDNIEHIIFNQLNHANINLTGDLSILTSIHAESHIDPKRILKILKQFINILNPVNNKQETALSYFYALKTYNFISQLLGSIEDIRYSRKICDEFLNFNISDELRADLLKVKASHALYFGNSSGARAIYEESIFLSEKIDPLNEPKIAHKVLNLALTFTYEMRHHEATREFHRASLLDSSLKEIYECMKGVEELFNDNLDASKKSITNSFLNFKNNNYTIGCFRATYYLILWHIRNKSWKISESLAITYGQKALYSGYWAFMDESFIALAEIYANYGNGERSLKLLGFIKKQNEQLERTPLLFYQQQIDSAYAKALQVCQNPEQAWEEGYNFTFEEATTFGLGQPDSTPIFSLSL